jgi:hypothetical protein
LTAHGTAAGKLSAPITRLSRQQHRVLCSSICKAAIHTCVPANGLMAYGTAAGELPCKLCCVSCCCNALAAAAEAATQNALQRFKGKYATCVPANDLMAHGKAAGELLGYAQLCVFMTCCLGVPDRRDVCGFSQQLCIHLHACQRRVHASGMHTHAHHLTSV